jgi:hypothetical protein
MTSVKAWSMLHTNQAEQCNDMVNICLETLLGQQDADFATCTMS